MPWHVCSFCLYIIYMCLSMCGGEMCLQFFIFMFYFTQRFYSIFGWNAGRNKTANIFSQLPGWIAGNTNKCCVFKVGPVCSEWVCVWVATLSTDLEWLSAVQLLADTSTEVTHVRQFITLLKLDSALFKIPFFFFFLAIFFFISIFYIRITLGARKWFWNSSHMVRRWVKGRRELELSRSLCVCGAGLSALGFICATPINGLLGWGWRKSD